MQLRRTVLKYLFLLAALALAVGLFWGADSRLSLQTFQQTPGEPQTEAPPETTLQAASTLLEPRYSGRDEAGRAWVVEAARAQQISVQSLPDQTLLPSTLAGTSTALSLTTLTAQLKLGTGSLAQPQPAPSATAETAYTFKADAGYFVQDADVLELIGNVKATGYDATLTLSRGVLNISTRGFTGTGPVRLVGQSAGTPFEFTGETLTLSENGNRISLTGNVTAQFKLPD